MKLCSDENLLFDKVEKIISDYIFTQREPLRDEILKLRNDGNPPVKERKLVSERILSKIKGFFDTFISGMGVE